MIPAITVGWKNQPLRIEPSSAGHHRRALGHGVLDEDLEVAETGLGCDRADLSGLVERVSDLECRHLLAEQPRELVIGVGVDDEALRVDAGLAVVRGARGDRPSQAAASRSADGRTMNGSEPPSSRTTCLTSDPAIDATERPAGSDPVRVAATTRRSRRTPSTRDAGMSSEWKEPFGKPPPLEERVEVERRLRNVRSVLEEPGVPCHEGGGGEADDLPEAGSSTA